MVKHQLAAPHSLENGDTSLSRHMCWCRNAGPSTNLFVVCEMHIDRICGSMASTRIAILHQNFSLDVTGVTRSGLLNRRGVPSSTDEQTKNWYNNIIRSSTPSCRGAACVTHATKNLWMSAHPKDEFLNSWRAAGACCIPALLERQNRRYFLSRFV